MTAAVKGVFFFSSDSIRKFDSYFAGGMTRATVLIAKIWSILYNILLIVSTRNICNLHSSVRYLSNKRPI